MQPTEEAAIPDGVTAPLVRIMPINSASVPIAMQPGTILSQAQNNALTGCQSGTMVTSRPCRPVLPD